MPIGDFLFGTKWTPQFAGDQQSFGVIPLVWGTLYLTGIGLLVAIPVGILSGIYLSEFAPRRVRKVVKPVLEVLAGVPTIVFGYFALTFFTPEVLRDTLGLGVNQFNALVGGHHPRHPRRPDDRDARRGRDVGGAAVAARGLGRARRQQGADGDPRRLPGGALRRRRRARARRLARDRRDGDHPDRRRPAAANLSLNPYESYQSMAAFIAATSRGDIPTGSIEYETIFVVGMTLFVLTLILNIVSIRLVRKYRQVYE